MQIDIEGDIETPPTPATFKGFKLPNDGKLPFPMTKEEASQWLTKRKESIRPWATFFATSRFKAPKSANRLSSRIVRNVDFFQSNYLFVYIGLFMYCLVTSPLLLLVFGIVLGVCYGIFTRNMGGPPPNLFGKEVSLVQQYSIVGLCSMPLFYLVGAGQVLFWVMGVSCFLILAHAAFYDLEEKPDEESFELTMEHVV